MDTKYRSWIKTELEFNEGNVVARITNGVAERCCQRTNARHATRGDAVEHVMELEP